MNDSPVETAALDALRRDYRRLLERMEANQDQFRRLARSVLRVQEDERRRLARDLHDGIGQNLTALKHQLTLLAAELGPGHPAWLARLEASIGLCAATLAETREMSRLLRPQVLDDLGLEAGLRWLARTLGESGGVEVQVRIEALPEPDGELQTLLFRIAQEALGNVVRHAGARTARLSLERHGDRLQLAVSDDGHGFDVDAALAGASAGRSAGLPGMRERLVLHGGQLRIESAPGTGTRVLASVPVGGEAGTIPP